MLVLGGGWVFVNVGVGWWVGIFNVSAGRWVGIFNFSAGWRVVEHNDKLISVYRSGIVTLLIVKK